MFDWVYSAPLGVAALTMAVIFVGFTWVGSIFVAPILRVFVRSRAGTNGIVGNILSSFGVLYGILLGLTAVAAYQNWSGVQSIVVDEAGALLAVHTDEVSSFGSVQLLSHFLSRDVGSVVMALVRAERIHVHVFPG
jgi:hypothetical protein